MSNQSDCSVTLLSTNAARLQNEFKQKIFSKALLIRKVEESLLAMYSRGEIHGTVHTCIGQELSGVIVSEFLEKGDAVFSNHRCHGHYLSFTDDVDGLIAEVAGKATGVCGGRGGSQHLHKDGFYSNGIQGGIVPVAAGIAWALKLSNSSRIAVVFIGDGTLGEGVVYETLNIASVLNLPLLIVLENNQYAQSTHQAETMSGDICERARAFNVNTAISNTWDWQGLHKTTDKLINFIRTSSRPAFLQIDTYRLMPHSKGDDYRNPAEIELYQKRDPLTIFLQENVAAFETVINEINNRVNSAVFKANHASFPNLIESAKDSTPYMIQNSSPLVIASERYAQLLNKLFLNLMNEYPEIIFFGEDVRSPYGGAFKISQGLSDKYSDRVINMPISEASIVGLGCGLACSGYRPIVEIMFGDFITLAFDQIINHASKFKYMYNNQVSVPLIIRTPMGGGRGYGPTHSQTLDKHLLGIPGLNVIALNNLIAPEIVYKIILEQYTDPTVVLENKLLYTQYLRTTPPQGFSFQYLFEPLPTIVLSPKSKHIDITLIGYGGMSEILINIAEILFYEHELITQFICITQIYPYSIENHVNTIKQSKFVFLIEEGQGFAGFGSEILAQISELIPDFKGLCQRIYSKPMPIAASRALEAEILPNQGHILKCILNVCALSYS
ncbi:MAG: pyruvate dehydrogenase [Tatlockia sp.]|nr:pyruvate dehydrogenase [Tatlockia sp.]